MIVSNALKTSLRRVVFVPVYIGYDRVFEVKSYQKELRGKKKQSESLKGLFKSLEIFKNKLGGAYVSFGQSVDLNHFLESRLGDEILGAKDALRPGTDSLEEKAALKGGILK